MSNFLRNLSMILLEADNEEETQSDDYSMDSEVSDLSDSIDNEEPEEESTEEDSEEESEEAEDYSMDSEEESEEGEEDSADMEEESEEDDSSSQEKYKKYKLLQVYRDLLSDIKRLSSSINTLQDNLDKDLRDHSLYIENKLKELKDKCTFVVQYEFLNKPYTVLLTSFLYFKKELDEILILIEKIIKYNKE